MSKSLELKQEDENPQNFEIRSSDWLENSPVCTKVVDPDFNLLYMSKAGVEALCIKNIASYYGKPFPLDFYPSEFRDNMYEKLQMVKDNGGTAVHEGMLKAMDGKELWFESTISPVYDSKNKLDYFMVVSVEISKQKQAEAKDILLKEIHHRIKNNLQIVSSLLLLQAEELDNQDLKKIMENSNQRICAISLVHEKMYASDVSGRIFVKPYIEDLIENISSAYLRDDVPFERDIQIDNFKLDMDLLVPCSLILNEIITNIFKYGFESNPNPLLKVHVLKKENKIFIIVADNGTGMDTDKENIKNLSLGTRLIKALAIQIKAKIEVDSSPNTGVCYRLEIDL